jgi:hypothetical protein
MPESLDARNARNRLRFNTLQAQATAFLLDPELCAHVLTAKFCKMWDVWDTFHPNNEQKRNIFAHVQVLFHGQCGYSRQRYLRSWTERQKESTCTCHTQRSSTSLFQLSLLCLRNEQRAELRRRRAWRTSGAQTGSVQTRSILKLLGASQLTVKHLR